MSTCSAAPSRSLQVVGGFCWAISSSGAAVDVDLFYDEELSLGQKMYVSGDASGRGCHVLQPPVSGCSTNDSNKHEKGMAMLARVLSQCEREREREAR